MRVGVVCPYDLASAGGVQQLTWELAERLSRSVDVEAILVGAGTDAYVEGPGRDDSVIRAGRPVRLRANNSVVPMTISPASWARVRRALRNVDVIHIHEPFIPVVGWAALAMNSPKVVTFHADAPSWAASVYRRLPWVPRILQGSIVTAVSAAAAAHIPSFWGPVEIVPNAVDVASYRLPGGRVGRRVSFLGRDEPRKGLDVALAAWRAIRIAHPEAELVVMGATRTDSQDGVNFVGRVSEGEKRRILATSSIFVAPNTAAESFGIVLVEAMAAGCAVVASDLPAFEEVLGSDGTIVPVGDPAALAEAVIEFLDNPDRAASLGSAARIGAERYDWSTVLDQYLDAYRRALSM